VGEQRRQQPYNWQSVLRFLHPSAQAAVLLPSGFDCFCLLSLVTVLPRSWFEVASYGLKWLWGLLVRLNCPLLLS